MSNPVDVCWYTSAMVGAPALSGQAGKLIEVLDACLLTGFGSKTLSTLVVASGVATATVSAGHEFLDHVVVLVAGATPSGLNGKKRIAVVNSTTFTFDATGISDQTATGTITAKMAPPGAWSQAFSGTNKAAYQSTTIGATGLLLRVDDTAATYAAVRGYEGMSDVDTASSGAQLFPSTGNNWYLVKSSTANSTVRNWRLVADDALFYLFTQANGDVYWEALAFGDIVSFKAGDAYHAVLSAGLSTGYGSPSLDQLRTGVGTALARSYTQTGSWVSSARYAHSRNSTLGADGMAGNNPVDNGFWAVPVDAWEGSTVLRGMMPGLYDPLHASYPSDGTLITNVPQLPGRTLLIQGIAYAARGALDITGPWR